MIGVPIPPRCTATQAAEAPKMESNRSDLDAQIEQLLPEMAALIVAAVNLDRKPGDIDPDAPLYGDELALDSIDILEIALVVSKKYKVQLKAGGEDNAKIFASMRALTRYVAEHRGEG
jgi:acyl carrier protein